MTMRDLPDARDEDPELLRIETVLANVDHAGPAPRLTRI